MGRILMPPKEVKYPRPKAIGGEPYHGEVKARAWVDEDFGVRGTYRRIIDKIEWKELNGYVEIRFAYYFRKQNGTDTDWIYGQSAAHMSPETLVKLIKKAKGSPDFGSFGDSLKGIPV